MAGAVVQEEICKERSGSLMNNLREALMLPPFSQRVDLRGENREVMGAVLASIGVNPVDYPSSSLSAEGMVRLTGVKASRSCVGIASEKESQVMKVISCAADAADTVVGLRKQYDRSHTPETQDAAIAELQKVLSGLGVRSVDYSISATPNDLISLVGRTKLQACVSKAPQL